MRRKIKLMIFGARFEIQIQTFTQITKRIYYTLTYGHNFFPANHFIAATNKSIIVQSDTEEQRYIPLQCKHLDADAIPITLFQLNIIQSIEHKIKNVPFDPFQLDNYFRSSTGRRGGRLFCDVPTTQLWSCFLLSFLMPLIPYDISNLYFGRLRYGYKMSSRRSLI